MCGGLITGLHTKNGFYVPEGEEKKFSSFDDSGVLLVNPEDYRDMEGDEEEKEDVNETGSMGFDKEEDQMTYLGEEEMQFFKTQYPQSKNPLRDSNNGDAATVATSAIERESVFSNDKASVYSKKCVELAEKVAIEKKNREKLENQLSKIK